MALYSLLNKLVAAKIGLEPTTNRLTADCSTIELLGIDMLAADAGFEPAHTRVKVLCLTTWRIRFI